MRKRKLFIGALLAFAIAFLGIGYAAITARTLTVNGSASATAPDAEADVKFISVVESGTSTPADAAVSDTTSPVVSSTPNKTISISVTGLANKNDTITFTLTYKNFSTDYVANYDSTTGVVIADGGAEGSRNTEYFQITTTTPTASLNPNAEGSIDVTVKLIKQPVVDQTSSFTITFNYTAAALAS